MSNNLQIVFSPDKTDVQRAIIWLEEENNSQTEIYHYTAVLANHPKQNLGIIKDQNNTLGYVSWSELKNVAQIINTAIKPTSRGKGIGRKLFLGLIRHLKSTGILAIYFNCASGSEPFWLKMRCRPMPLISGYSDRAFTTMYLVLVPNQTKQKITENGISLFKNGVQADISWPIKFCPGTNRLLKPIIEPVDPYWRIATTINKQQGQAHEIIAFQHGASYVAPFLILRHL
jgi:GNAT superfamily N-acetyltransferase